MFKWGPYQPENVNSFYIAWSKKYVNSFYIAWSKKLTLRSLGQRRVTNNLNISANSILYSKQIWGMNQRTTLVLLMKEKKPDFKNLVQVSL